MLCLSRKPGETILIGESIRVLVYGVHGQQVRLGIEAPADTRIMRGELIGVPRLPVIRPVKRPPREWTCHYCGREFGPAAPCYNLGQGRRGCIKCCGSEAVQMSEWRLHGGEHPLGWDETPDNTQQPKGSSNE